MKKTQSINLKNTGIVINVGLGVLLALVCAFLLSILVTVLVENETIDLSSVPIYIYGIHAISVFIGTLISLTLEKGRLAVVAGIVAAAYFAILLCINMLVFSNGFEGIVGGAVSILVGGALSILLKAKMSGGKKRKVKMRSR